MVLRQELKWINKEEEDLDLLKKLFKKNKIKKKLLMIYKTLVMMFKCNKFKKKLGIIMS